MSGAFDFGPVVEASEVDPSGGALDVLSRFAADKALTCNGNLDGS